MKKHKGIVVLMAVLAGLSVQTVFADEKAKLFQKLDTNGDGVITMDEAEALADLPDSFADGDDDNDGKLTPEEFAKLEVTDE